MKSPLILTTLLLPGIAAAQQSSDTAAGKGATQPYRVVASLQTAAQVPADGDKIAKNKSADMTYILPAGSQISSGPTFYTPSTQSNVRVSLNLRNARLKEAVKQLSEQTKLEFVLDSDVPADARVTIVAKNIRLGTALDMLTDATDLKWGRKVTRKKDSKEAEVTYQIGKTVTQPFLQWSDASPTTGFFSNDNKLFQWNGKGQDLKLYKDLLKKDGTPLKPGDLPFLNGSLKIDSGKSLNLTKPFTYTLPGGTQFLQPNIIQGNIPMVGAYSLNNALIGTRALAEVHSTFTCPHCKQQVTVIHRHETTKCETCGRPFHDDWQFCPFDGGKRAAKANTDWQFCPLCGKSVKPEAKIDAKPAK
jgi:hypothetical protein